MKIKLSELRSFIRDAINEAENTPPIPQWQELPDASLDSEIDSFLVAAETNDGGLDEALLREAEPEPGAGVPAEDLKSAPEPVANEKDNPEIDVAGYSRDVAHLVENVDNLVDVRGTILRRALNYVGKKYGKEQAGLVQDVLESQYDLHYDRDSEEPTVAPAADRAGPSMAG